MRLLLVIDSLDTGGCERHTVDLALALHRGGHEVAIACSVGGPLATVLGGECVPCYALMKRLVKRRVSLFFGWKLRKLLRRERFDVVHAHMYASAVAVAIATLGSGVPLVLTQHSEARWRPARARLYSRWLYRRAAHVIAVSNSIGRLLADHHCVPADRITVLPSAVAAPVSKGRSALPAVLRGAPLVGVVARLQPEKGVAIFLEAVAHVSPLVPTCHFPIVGDGPLRQKLEVRAAQLGLQERVHFLGFRGDARELISLLDVLVVPSLSEGAPLVVLEAMTAGIPVVASATGGIPDMIRHDQEGLQVPPNDPMALGHAILSLLQDPVRARRLGEAGRRRAASQFRYGAMLQKVEAIYHAAAGIQRAAGTEA